jgi:hypothetical protein
MDTDKSIEQARRRMRMAREVLDWCHGIQHWEPTAAALELHHLHARHARERGDEATAAKAEKRYELVSEWHSRARRGH